jgi:hypothetical protein
MKRLFCKFILGVFVSMSCCFPVFSEPDCGCDAIENSAICEDAQGFPDPNCPEFLDCQTQCIGVPVDTKAWVLVLAGGVLALWSLSDKRIKEALSSSHS